MKYLKFNILLSKLKKPVYCRFILLLNGSELAVADNKGHVSMEKQPEAANNKIFEFLDIY